MKISNKNSNNNISSNIVNGKNNNELETNICVKCNKEFSSLQSLKLHMKTSDCTKDSDLKDKRCEYCNKSLSTKQMLKYHLDSCVEKKLFLIKNDYESVINKLKEEIIDLQNKIENKM